MIRLGSHRRNAAVALTAALALILGACFGGDGDTEGPTTDTGGAGSNTVVTLAPPPPPVTATTVDLQPPPVTQPPPPPPTQPPPTLGPETPLVYTIEEGDTLYSISRKFGVGVEALIEFNNIANPDVIRVGDTMVIPPTE